MASIVGPHDKYAAMSEAGIKVKKQPRMTETKLLKKRLLAAFDELGGLKGLVDWAKGDDDNLKFVYGQIFRLIPVERQISNEAPLVAVQIVSAVPRPMLPATPKQLEVLNVQPLSHSVHIQENDTQKQEIFVNTAGKKFRKPNALCSTRARVFRYKHAHTKTI